MGIIVTPAPIDSTAYSSSITNSKPSGPTVNVEVNAIRNGIPEEVVIRSSAALTDSQVLGIMADRFPDAKLNYNISALTAKNTYKVTQKGTGVSNAGQMTGINPPPDMPRPEVFDVFKHHNQALDVWDKAIKDGKMQKGGTLLHFDTHSDIIYGDNGTMTGRESIGDYLDTAIANGTFSEVYWVLPGWTKEPVSEKMFWDNRAGQGRLTDGQTEFTAYVKDGKAAFKKPDDLDSSPSSYRTVAVHKVTIDELPSFKGKNVSMDVDCDYFSNSGYDTGSDRYSTQANLSEDRLNEAMNSFFSMAREKGISPSAVTLSRSPKYTPPEDIRVIEQAFRQNMPGEFIPDSPENYAHWEPADRHLLDCARMDLQEKKEVSPEILDDLKERGFGDIAVMIKLYNRDRSDALRSKLIEQIDERISPLDNKIGKAETSGPSITEQV